MPEARRNLKVAAIDDKLYALGGYAEPFQGLEKGNFCYDTAHDTWSVKADMLIGRSNFAICAVRGKLYAIGGDRFLDDGEVYDPLKDSWNSIASMPTARQHINCSVIRNEIYIPGGRISYSDNPDETIIDTHEVYDIKRNSWKTISPCPKKIENPSISVVKGKLYVIDYKNRSLRVYDPRKDHWEEKQGIPSAHFIAGATVIEEKIFVLDGVRPEEDFSRVFVYNTAHDSWREATSLPEGLKLSGFTSVDNTLYIVGGCNPDFAAQAHVYRGDIEEIK